MTDFDINDPPETYKVFRRTVLRILEEVEHHEDDEPGDEYPICLFMVNRANKGEILYPQDLIEEYDFDEDFPMSVIMHSFFPVKVAEFNAKFFAVVFQGVHEDENGDETDIVMCYSSSSIPTEYDPTGETDFLKSEIIEEQGELGLEPWERISTESYSDLVIPFRRSVCPQG